MTPQIERLEAFARSRRRPAQLISSLFSSLQSSGAVDGLLEFTYYAAAAFARYDAISHILPAYSLATPCEAITTAAYGRLQRALLSFTGAAGDGERCRRAASHATAHSRATRRRRRSAAHAEHQPGQPAAGGTPSRPRWRHAPATPPSPRLHRRPRLRRCRTRSARS